jgi:hypothetical protein
MKRRQVLVGIAGVAVVGALATRASEESGIAAMIMKRLSYLKLDPSGVRQFARDFASRHVMSEGKLRVVSAAGPLYGWLPQRWAERLTPDVTYGEERVITLFLLSSDFFGTGADASRTVRYLGFFDPLRGGNPFALLRVQTGQVGGHVLAASCEEPCSIATD